MVDKFASLDDETQETIVKMAALAAAIGPVLLLGGKLAGGVKLYNRIIWQIYSCKYCCNYCYKCYVKWDRSAGLAAKAGALLLNPWTAAIAAGGRAAYGLYKHLSQE